MIRSIISSSKKSQVNASSTTTKLQYNNSLHETHFTTTICTNRNHGSATTIITMVPNYFQRKRASSYLLAKNNNYVTKAPFNEHFRKRPLFTCSINNSTINTKCLSSSSTKKMNGLISRNKSSSSAISSSKIKTKGKKAVEEEEVYQSLTPIEHILHRPGMYIGQKQSYTEENVYKFDMATNAFKYMDGRSPATEVASPALIKIFDEILVNASDHRMKYPKECNRIDISIDPGIDYDAGLNITEKVAVTTKKRRTPKISVRNNGKGIPIYIHEKEGIYIPELLFGRLLTGSNFNDDTNRITAGTHGYGAKLTNIFSKSFEIETTDSIRQLKYKQIWKDNMTYTSEQEILPCTTEDSYTCIAFEPDLSRLMNVETNNGAILSEDYKDMIQRVYDFAGCLPTTTDSPCEVYLNDKRIPISGFQQYISLHAPTNNDNKNNKSIYTQLKNYWEVGVTLSPSSSSYHQISFINGTKTKRGGNHVDIILKQIISSIKNHVLKLQPSWEEILKPNIHIKRFICVFINAFCINPTFDSQVKDYLTSSIVPTGKEYQLPTSFLKSLVEENGLGIIEQVIKSIQQTQQLPLLKLTSILQKRTSLILPKLEDAHYAGSKNKSKDCTLILTEGDSAKALALSGLEVLGREMYGVFPLRGKFLNVRSVSSSTNIWKNVEVKHLCQILNLRVNCTYDTEKERKTLRYGHVMLMTDQDSDGSHIKGLLMNFFRFFWPKLLLPTDSNDYQEQKPFLSCFITPLLKASLSSSTSKKASKTTLSFFNQQEYNKWKHTITPQKLSKYKIKYYKGLGTSTPLEAKEYFKNFNKHVVQYKWNSEENDGQLLDMVFDKEKSEERKNWIISQSSSSSSSPYTASEKDGSKIISKKNDDSQELTYEDFINHELINYSQTSIHRSIPHILDGLKPSQRKVLYACFLKKLYPNTNEIKIAQLSGYCSEQTAYHHGEASLQSTIIKMSQDYVGSNNINLLQPIGQFGTRHEGGEDAASPRYIYTKLEPICRLLFPEVDDNLLVRREDDGFVVEPIYYIPIIPLLLVNGAAGIGSGWSTSIPSFNVHDIIQSIRFKLKQDDNISNVKNDTPPSIRPYIRGFQGTITPKDPNNEAAGYITKGVYKQHSPTTIEITELPVGKWTKDYKTFLIALRDKGIIKSFVENHTSNNISFTITLPRNTKIIQKNKEEYYNKTFSLSKPLSLSNMYAFYNDTDELKKYTAPNEILDDFFPKRLELYQHRKDFLIQQYSSKVSLLHNKVKFMDYIRNNVIDMKQLQQNKKDVFKMLSQEYGFIPYSKIQQGSSTNNNSTEDNNTPTTKTQDYDYLLNISLNSFTSENLQKLQKEEIAVEKEYMNIMKKTIDDLWLEDLDELEKYLNKHYK